MTTEGARHIEFLGKQTIESIGGPVKAPVLRNSSLSWPFNVQGKYFCACALIKQGRYLAKKIHNIFT